MSLLLLFRQGGGTAEVGAAVIFRSIPPLALHVEVEDFSGRTWRWAAEERAAWDIPSNLSCSSRRGDGFAEASATLRRPITRDFPDLGLLHTMRFIGPDGSVAWEGRVTAFPRSSAPDGETFQVTGAGWMSHATDRTFQEIYVDRDLGRWEGGSTQRKLNLATSTYIDQGNIEVNQDEATGQPALGTRMVGPWLGNTRTEAWYFSHGIKIGSIYYAWKRSSDINAGDGNNIWEAVLASDDVATTYQTSGNLRAAGPGSGTVSATADRYAAHVYKQHTAAITTATDMHTIFWTVLAVRGDHGLTSYGTEDYTTAKGYHAQDVIENIVARFCPHLSIGEVDDVSYIIEQLAFHDPVTPYDAIKQVNEFHLYDLAVWEDRKFHWTQPKALDDWDWEVRLDDPATQANLQGDSIEDVANGIVVRYTDLISGKEQVLTPETHTELADDSESNPANLAGLDRWTEISLSYSTLEADATQIGRAALGEFSRPKAPGEIQTGPTIKDRAGNSQPGWKPRAGDRVVIADHPNDAPRRITDTRWDEASKTLSLTTDLYSARLEALFSRIIQGRSARGL